MGHFRLLILLLFVMVPDRELWAFEYQLNCDSSRKLVSVEPIATSETAMICSAFTVRGFNCFDSFTPSKDSRLMTLSSPVFNYYSPKKKSASYLRSAIEEIIAESLAAGLDPYVVLSIVILENAPTPGHQAYAHDYGNPPIDGGTLRKMWGCSRDNSIPQNGTPTLRLFAGADPTAKSRTTWLCEISGSNERKWDSPVLRLGQKSDSCCARIIHFEKDDYELIRKVKSQTALMHIKNYFSRLLRSKILEGGSSLEEKLALLFQGYNGYGRIGATEAVKNSCLQGLEMKKEPIYGAGVGDLMVNFLMGNSEIRNIVKQFSQGEAVPSFACQILGEGRHSIDPRKFSLMQYHILINRPGCAKRPFDFNGIIRNFRQFEETTMLKYRGAFEK